MDELAARQLAQNLAFKVETVPHEVVLPTNGDENMTPLNVKIRVRKKDDGKSAKPKGIIFVPKSGTAENLSERLRLASSDHTILSFNMLMEAEYERKRRSRKNTFFGSCLGAQTDDDDGPYLPTTDSRSESRFEKIKLKNITPDEIGTSQALMRRNTNFFGVCKPGGCMDPPFGEDRYAYQKAVKRNESIIQGVCNKENKPITPIRIEPVEPVKVNERYEDSTVKVSRKELPEKSDDDKPEKGKKISKPENRLSESKRKNSGTSNIGSVTIDTKIPRKSLEDQGQHSRKIEKNQRTDSNSSRPASNEFNTIFFSPPRKDSSKESSGSRRNSKLEQRRNTPEAIKAQIQLPGKDKKKSGSIIVEKSMYGKQIASAPILITTNTEKGDSTDQIKPSEVHPDRSQEKQKAFKLSQREDSVGVSKKELSIPHVPTNDENKTKADDNNRTSTLQNLLPAKDLSQKQRKSSIVIRGEELADRSKTKFSALPLPTGGSTSQEYMFLDKNRSQEQKKAFMVTQGEESADVPKRELSELSLSMDEKDKAKGHDSKQTSIPQDYMLAGMHYPKDVDDIGKQRKNVTPSKLSDILSSDIAPSPLKEKSDTDADKKSGKGSLVMSPITKIMIAPVDKTIQHSQTDDMVKIKSESPTRIYKHSSSELTKTCFDLEIQAKKDSGANSPKINNENGLKETAMIQGKLSDDNISFSYENVNEESQMSTNILADLVDIVNRSISKENINKKQELGTSPKLIPDHALMDSETQTPVTKETDVSQLSFKKEQFTDVTPYELLEVGDRPDTNLRLDHPKKDVDNEIQLQPHQKPDQDIIGEQQFNTPFEKTKAHKPIIAQDSSSVDYRNMDDNHKLYPSIILEANRDYINLAFQKYSFNNKIGIKTLDADVNFEPDENIVRYKSNSDADDKDFTIPLDGQNVMTITIKHSFTTGDNDKKELLEPRSKIQKDSYSFNEVGKRSSFNEVQKYYTSGDDALELLLKKRKSQTDGRHDVKSETEAKIFSPRRRSVSREKKSSLSSRFVDGSDVSSTGLDDTKPEAFSKNGFKSSRKTSKQDLEYSYTRGSASVIAPLNKRGSFILTTEEDRRRFSRNDRKVKRIDSIESRTESKSSISSIRQIFLTVNKSVSLEDKGEFDKKKRSVSEYNRNGSSPKIRSSKGETYNETNGEVIDDRIGITKYDSFHGTCKVGSVIQDKSGRGANTFYSSDEKATYSNAGSKGGRLSKFDAFNQEFNSRMHDSAHTRSRSMDSDVSNRINKNSITYFRSVDVNTDAQFNKNDSRDNVAKVLDPNDSRIAIIGREINRTLSFVYEHELIPLQNVIKGLKQDIDVLAEQQVLLKEKLHGPRRIRPIRKCGCLRNYDVFSIME